MVRHRAKEVSQSKRLVTGLTNMSYPLIENYLKPRVGGCLGLYVFSRCKVVSFILTSPKSVVISKTSLIRIFLFFFFVPTSNSIQYGLFLVVKRSFNVKR